MILKSKKPKHIIQIFDNSYEYTKDSRSYEDRKHQYAWKKEVSSYSGKLSGDQLRVCKHQLKTSKLDNSDFIFLLDHNSETLSETLKKFGYLDPAQIHELKKASDFRAYQIEKEVEKDIEYVFYSRLLNSAFKWKCFKFHIDQVPVIDLEYDEFTLGKPSRDNFTICMLEKNIPIEIKINGKSDMSLFGRRERTYHEINVIVNYLGTANSLEVVDEPIIKKIPLPEKTINLLKTLY